ncbi:ABC transporter substrate-binding protein [Streptomyces sp. NPDC055078]
MKRYVSAAAGMVLLAAVAGCGAPDDSGSGTVKADGDTCKPLTKTEKVVIGGSSSLGYGTSVQARAGGHYTAEKLEVETKNFATTQDTIALVARGEIDAALGGFSANLFSAISQGMDVRLVSSNGMATAENPPSGVFVRKDLVDSGKVEDIADLKGRSLGFTGTTGSPASFLVSTLLGGGGLKLTDVKATKISSSDAEAAMGNKRIDASFATTPYATSIVKNGAGVRIGDYKLVANVSTGGIVLGPNLLKKRPDVACALLRANVLSAREALGPGYSKRAETVEAFVKYADFPKEFVESSPEYVYDPTLDIPPASMEAMQKVFIEQGALDLDAPLPYEKVVDVGLRKAMVASLDKKPSR